MLFTTELLTEKGNLKAPVIADIKAQALGKIDLALEATPNGVYAMELGTSEDGRPFYLTVALTVGTVDPFVKHEKKAAVAAAPIAVPAIFEQYIHGRPIKRYSMSIFFIGIIGWIQILGFAALEKEHRL